MKTTKSILSLFKLTLSTYLGIKNKKRGCPFETASFLFEQINFNNRLKDKGRGTLPLQFNY